MAEYIRTINGVKIFTHDWDRWKNYEDVNSLTSEGVAFRFWNWLNNNGKLFSEDESVMDVYNNMSGARDGNRFDIHDNYMFDEDLNLEIVYLYVVNGNLWATLYDKSTDKYYGDFEVDII